MDGGYIARERRSQPHASWPTLNLAGEKERERPQEEESTSSADNVKFHKRLYAETGILGGEGEGEWGFKYVGVQDRALRGMVLVLEIDSVGQCEMFVLILY